MKEKFLQPYEPGAIEDTIYKKWETSGVFNPDVCIEKGYTAPEAEHFSIVLPPPNVTGHLHLGHSFENATQDVLIRFHRMRGKKTLWVPGTDHAAIATQSKFEKNLYKKEKKSRHDFQREEFFNMIQEFALTNQSTILSQLRKMGGSLDWSRLAFTLDEERQHAVYHAFKKLHDAGLIYQKDRIVNWDPKGQTTISDDEIIHEPRKAKLYTFKYSKDFPITIATTRPETKLGDTGVAVHPYDKRYRAFMGKEYTFNFAGEDVTVKIVGDEAVDPEFGTGAVGVTPAHSQTDWEIGERHDLPVKSIINEYGKMTVGIEGVKNAKTYLAREAVVQWLKSEGLLEKEEEIDQNVAIAERTGAVIEPLPKLQWWLSVDTKFPYPHDSLEGIEKDQKVSLKDLMLHVVESGQVTIMPERFGKTYRHWIENLRDWNISRQILYGHRIPVWYKDNHLQVSETAPGDGWEQDPDTLDTWFSSGLWTFSTLGWPHETKDITTYHPTNVVNPGYEILQLWVSRMILMSTFLVGQIPFTVASIHGMLRDAQGQKFSKSLNNGINPLEVIKEYGTDALRMSLIVGVAPGQDMNFDLQKVKAYKKFANKLWNITRFILENTEDTSLNLDLSLTREDNDLLATQEIFLKQITSEMEEYKFYLVGEKLYHYIWHELADNVLENSKTIFEKGDNEAKKSRKQFLVQTLQKYLKALHPFMPFITEEIWSLLPDSHKNSSDMLIVQKWPTPISDIREAKSTK